MRNKIKNFRRYMRKLKTYAKILGITIQYDNDPDEGSYDHTQRLITINRNSSQTAKIASMLHELGHSIDDFTFTRRNYLQLLKSYTKFQDERYTEKCVEDVIACERRAWKNAKLIAKMLNIPLGAWYFKDKEKWLSSYRSARREV